MTGVLAIHATVNSPRKSDASGAFISEAVAFQKFAVCHREGFDNRLKGAPCREQVEGILRRYRDLEVVALFCHGYRSGLQTGHNMATVGALADAIAAASGPHVVVVLYACSTAGMLSLRRGGFADALRDALTARGKAGHVDAHTIAAHAVWNPFVQRFDMGESYDELQGDWVVWPKSPEWKRWRARLRADGDTLCYRFPTMTIGEVRAEVATPLPRALP